MSSHPTSDEHDVETKTDLQGCIVTFHRDIETRGGTRIPEGVPCLVGSRPHSGVTVTSPPCPGCGSKNSVMKVDYSAIKDILARAFTVDRPSGRYGRETKEGDTNWKYIFDNQDEYPEVMSRIRRWREEYDRFNVKQDTIEE